MSKGSQAPIIQTIKPNWQVADTVHACVTVRTTGYSEGDFGHCNLANGVGDSSQNVQMNRQLLNEQLALPESPRWMNQVHGNDVVEWSRANVGEIVSADGCWTSQTDVVCTIMTADCLPVFFYHTVEQSIAVCHAGWKGLLTGVIENTINSMTSSPEYITAWLGPAIGPENFEVGPEIKEQFCAQTKDASSCFIPSQLNDDSKTHDRYLADIYGLAKLRLKAAGVKNISGGEFCTFDDNKQFYSYRRDGVTGRMANIIWRTES